MNELYRDGMIWFACYLGVSAVCLMLARVIGQRWKQKRNSPAVAQADKSQAAVDDDAPNDLSSFQTADLRLDLDLPQLSRALLHWIPIDTPVIRFFRTTLFCGSLAVGAFWTWSSQPHSPKALQLGAVIAVASFLLLTILRHTRRYCLNVRRLNQLPNLIDVLAIHMAGSTSTERAIQQTIRRLKVTDRRFAECLKRNPSDGIEDSAIAQLILVAGKSNEPTIPPESSDQIDWLRETAERLRTDLRVDSLARSQTIVRRMRGLSVALLGTALGLVLLAPVLGGFLEQAFRFNHADQPPVMTPEEFHELTNP